MAARVERPRRRFTIEEYERMVETGILKQDDRVELIEGEIVEMSPIGDPHAALVTNLTHVFVRLAGDRARVRVQGPIRVPPRSLPQPDLALLRARSYRRAGATTHDVLLVIEVADTSLEYDRTVKLALYALAGIGEYWVVDANSDTVHVYRSPSGPRYREHRQAVAGDAVATLAFPDDPIDVAAIFV
ncbi:MAG TPA: Uma2 family endonuclease [Methylomirabilota bacterium]|nr:Uma2 family endonuclease [Methylomirabilota bacterium]